MSPAMAWRYLIEHDWRNHPLNRFRGAMALVLAWASAQLLFGIALIAGLLDEGTDLLFLEAVPDGFEWVLWIIMIAGPFVIVPSILMRRSWLPWLYTGYIAVTFLLLACAELWELNWLSAARYATEQGRIEAAVFALAVTIDLIVIRYLFLGQRANL
ncbi:MAG: hypothetical protein AAGI13_01175, partial [Pseudomonadota bacterium]